MNLILLGMNIKRPPEYPGRLSISCEEGIRSLKELMHIPSIEGMIYLSTCNRAEFLAQTQDLGKRQSN